MKVDLNNPYFIDKFLVSNEFVSRKKQFWSWFILVSCGMLYILSMVIQAAYAGKMSVNGIIAQLQVLFSVSMILGTAKPSYKIAFSLNFINAGIVSVNFIRTNDISILPGTIVPIITIMILAIIRMFNKGVNAKIVKIVHQHEELSMLYEEIAAAEEELAEQNRQLNDYNRTLQKNEERLNFLAYFDSLTELPNRKMILDRLELLIRISKTDPMKFFLIFIDLDNFKKINDSLGHHAGDILLRTVVKRLQSVIHPEDLLGRLGGDEFALIIQRQLKEEELLFYLEGIRETLQNAFIIEDSKFVISASFGVSMFPQDGDNATDLMKSADTAMYKAKEIGRNGIQFFSVEMKNEILKRIEFENILRDAVEQEEFHLVYQPQYKPHPKQLRGIEVLTRWHSAKLGIVSPEQFIPVAEETGLIVPLGEWIIRTACQQSKYLKDTCQTPVVMSINISAVQIMEPSFVDMVKRAVAETECDPACIEFEITESVFISSMDYVISVLAELKRLGIRIALDDFGTGYSSLSYLQRLPIDTLKIDRSFINGIDQQHTKKPIVGSIISLVHQMDISVVAEGVENENQLHYLKDQNCDYIQGFYWGKPLTGNDVKALMVDITS
ncbi:putative bifunctional diguanylate cyclase/phosphodiesterase [Paenibacillus xylaniclasticus]|uniref:putative bifunctional diguanylate cyclase/phosphodiesterase n=1 Tax=Paenibacillus xylaniclasticus TaxID=588083 RepID=UPI000FD85CC1|nr:MULTISPECIES: bifunctional diguanylate cyclase/phosphodiesterase [Paenibacillus]GFN31376.1 hypothetical protein PCURB6_16360 [Paenibacillus curdlanolyticus]